MIVMQGPGLFAKHALVAAIVMIAAATSPARADRCDDLAASMKSQIDGVAIGKTAANMIYLSHPSATQVRLGCASRNRTNEIFAATDARKPSPAFLAFVADASAIIFTIPRTDALKGVARCAGRIGFLRGNDIKLRYRRLDMRCIRDKAGTSIAVSRDKDA